jgi:hypothetical protein
MKKIAVTIIHGVGRQKDNYAEKVAFLLKKMFLEKIKKLGYGTIDGLVIEPVYWAEVFEAAEDQLFKSLVEKKNLNFKLLRRFIIHYIADAIAYQPIVAIGDNYALVHKKVSESLKLLAKNTGSDAPLCVISHSLGSVIASNFFYDLQQRQGIRMKSNDLSPLEKGETLTLFYSIGTTLPLWSLRYQNYNKPISIPSPQLEKYYPGLKGEWINFYDRDDLLGYPLKGVSPEYDKAVTDDKKVNAGGILVSWNPLSHTAYMADKSVLNPIVDGLIKVWKQINQL